MPCTDGLSVETAICQLTKSRRLSGSQQRDILVQRGGGIGAHRMPPRTARSLSLSLPLSLSLSHTHTHTHTPSPVSTAAERRGLPAGRASKPSIHPSSSTTSGRVATISHSLSGARSPFPLLADLSYRGTATVAAPAPPSCLSVLLAVSAAAAKAGSNEGPALSPPPLLLSKLVKARIVRRPSARSCVPGFPRTCSKGFVGYLAARASFVVTAISGAAERSQERSGCDGQAKSVKPLGVYSSFFEVSGLRITNPPTFSEVIALLTLRFHSIFNCALSGVRNLMTTGIGLVWWNTTGVWRYRTDVRRYLMQRRLCGHPTPNLCPPAEEYCSPPYPPKLKNKNRLPSHAFVRCCVQKARVRGGSPAPLP